MDKYSPAADPETEAHEDVGVADVLGAERNAIEPADPNKSGNQDSEDEVCQDSKGDGEDEAKDARPAPLDSDQSDK